VRVNIALMTTRKLSKDDYFNSLKSELDNWIREVSFSESIMPNSVNLAAMFDSSNSYRYESEMLAEVFAEQSNTKKQGDALESLIKSLFKRVKLFHSVEITNKDITLGQVDIQIIPIHSSAYDLFGVDGCHKPKLIIGECKNYKKSNSGKISKEEVEKTCWRSLKGNCLTFLIGYGYTRDALHEISYYNSNIRFLCQDSSPSKIIPLTISMIEFLVQEDVNFCYFLRWAIEMSTSMNINNYIRDGM
jgi:hypothetical protein